MALIKKIPSVPVAGSKQKVVAFVHWSLPTVEGRSIKSSKGFPIFKKPNYPNIQEDFLVELAEKNGGTVSVTMECKIVLSSQTDTLMRLNQAILCSMPEPLPSRP